MYLSLHLILSTEETLSDLKGVGVSFWGSQATCRRAGEPFSSPRWWWGPQAYALQGSVSLRSGHGCSWLPCPVCRQPTCSWPLVTFAVFSLPEVCCCLPTLPRTASRDFTLTRNSSWPPQLDHVPECCFPLSYFSGLCGHNARGSSSTLLPSPESTIKVTGTRNPQAAFPENLGESTAFQKSQRVRTRQQKTELWTRTNTRSKTEIKHRHFSTNE